MGHAALSGRACVCHQRQFVRIRRTFFGLLDGGRGFIRSRALGVERDRLDPCLDDRVPGRVPHPDSLAPRLALLPPFAPGLDGDACAAPDDCSLAVLRARFDRHAAGVGSLGLHGPVWVAGAPDQAAQRRHVGHSFALDRFSAAFAAGDSGFVETAGSRHPVPGCVDFDLFRRRTRGVLRRIGTLPASDCRAGLPAGVAYPAEVAGRGICLSTGAKPFAGRRQLSALGWLPQVCRIA